ncbi:MAG: PmoA family protein [Armatimonadota bacterium]
MRGLVLCALCAGASALHAAGLELVQGPGSTVRASWDGKPVFVYNYDPGAPKPCVHPFHTPAGREVTLNSPPDHPHHRGLMLAWGNVIIKEGGQDVRIDFWGEAGAPEGLGRIVHKELTETKTAEDRAWLVTTNEWRRRSDDALLLTERRQLTVFRPESERCHLLTWLSEFTAADLDLVIGGTPGRQVSYYGLGLRVPRDMDGGQFLDAEGRSGAEAVNGQAARWCAYTSPNEPRRGFAMFDHPDNPRHPTGWFAMNNPFGYLTASLVAREAYPLPAGERLRLCYGVLAFDGAATPDFLEAQYRRWLEKQGRAAP